MREPKILIAILARDKEATLPLYLKCILNLEYDKKNIVLYIRTNDNADNTVSILEQFITDHGSEYAHVEFDSSSSNKEMTRNHEWNSDRFKVLGAIRQTSLNKTIEYECDNYFVVDCDNFILPHTLKSLLKFDVPIISPMMRCDNGSLYSNYHSHVDQNGYLQDHPLYHDVWHRRAKGSIPVAVVHCTYLIKKEVIPQLYYDDESYRYEYVIFSDSARKNNILQYIENSVNYGVITFKTNVEEMIDFEEKHLKPLL